MEIIIKNNKVMIDDCDFEMFSKYRWSITTDGYVKATNWYGETIEYKKNRPTHKKQKTLMLHRYLMDVWDSIIIDHIDGNRLNNSRSNLRKTDYFGNARNRKGDSDKKSGLPKGVYMSGKPNKIYRVRLQTKIKKHEGGHFNCIAAAVLKYDELARKHFGEFARSCI